MWLIDMACSKPEPGPDSKSARLKKLSPFKGKKFWKLDLDADEIQFALINLLPVNRAGRD